MARKSDKKFKYEMGPITFNGERHSLEETAQMLGLTKQGVLAIERRALAKLKAGLEKHGIKGLDDVFNLREKSDRDEDAGQFVTM